MRNKSLFTLFLLLGFALSTFSVACNLVSMLKNQPTAAEATPPSGGLLDVTEPTGPTSVERIQQAEANGELDPETSLLYQVYALFNDEQVPEAYRGEAPTWADFEQVLRTAALRRASLSPEAQQVLTPYLARPTEPISIFYSDADSAQSRGGGHLSAMAAATPTWKSVDGDFIRVWYQGGGRDEKARKNQATLVKDTAEKARQKFTALLLSRYSNRLIFKNLTTYFYLIMMLGFF